MPNYAYRFALAEGAVVRGIYRALLPQIISRKIPPSASIPFEVFAYSGHAALPEQVASIRSFLRHVGRPKTFTIVSDGSYTNGDIELLQRLDSSVLVADFRRDVLPDVPMLQPHCDATERMRGSTSLRQYLGDHPTGKQLALIMSLPRNGPALYVDSDVLFFPGARDLLALAQTRAVPAFYLADCQFSGDARLIRAPDERDKPANTGALFLLQKLDWSLGLERFEQLNGAVPQFFTNQTMTHLVMHANRAAPFDPAKYILQLDDQTIYRDRYAAGHIVLRHYVNPVRHKFWTTLWRQ